MEFCTLLSHLCAEMRALPDKCTALGSQYKAIHAGLLLAHNSYRLSLSVYRNAKTLQKHCRMQFKNYETK